MNNETRQTEKRLDLAIRIVAGLIVVTLLVGGGYYAYTLLTKSAVSPVIQQEIDKTKAEIAKDPKNADLHVKLARLYMSENLKSQAQQELEQALKLNKDNVAALTLLGTIYEERGDDAKAATYYKKAIALAEKTEFKALNMYLYESYFRLGTIYIRQKEYDKAIEVLKKDAELNAMDSDVHYQLGLAYLKKGDTDAAVAELQDAVKYVPDYAEAHFALGQAYEKKGEPDKAVEEYELAVDYKADYKEAKEALDRLK